MIPHYVLRQYIGQGMISPDLADQYARGLMPRSQMEQFELHVQYLMNQERHPPRMEEPAAVKLSTVQSKGIDAARGEAEQQSRAARDAQSFDPDILAAMNLIMSGRATDSQLDRILKLEGNGKKPDRIVNKTMYLKI